MLSDFRVMQSCFLSNKSLGGTKAGNREAQASKGGYKNCRGLSKDRDQRVEDEGMSNKRPKPSHACGV